MVMLVETGDLIAAMHDDMAVSLILVGALLGAAGILDAVVVDGALPISRAAQQLLRSNFVRMLLLSVSAPIKQGVEAPSFCTSWL